MKNTLIIFAFIFSFYLNAQKNIEAKELTRKEIRLLKKQKAFEKQKARYEKRGLNAWGINEYAPNIVSAIREHLGVARIDSQNGTVILREAFSFKSGKVYPLWVVDGQIFNNPPETLPYQDIRDVRVYRSLAETNKWGQMGRAGVIEIITLNN
tara:strand:- start:640 stop:1098 length:459 start_codon:yes stop_codon:yes gene_type:complete